MTLSVVFHFSIIDSIYHKHLGHGRSFMKEGLLEDMITSSSSSKTMIQYYLSLVYSLLTSHLFQGIIPRSCFGSSSNMAKYSIR